MADRDPIRQFSGKVALVTGASSGIGKATALELARQGADISVFGRDLGRDLDRMAETCERVRAFSVQTLALNADVTSAIQALEFTFGRIDVVVANAGANGAWAPIEQITLEEWNRTLATNLTSTFLTTKAATPLLKRNGGAIVITASGNGSRMFSNTGATAYSSSKAAQIAFAKMMALELARWKVRVNVICPGWIEQTLATGPSIAIWIGSGFRLPTTIRRPCFGVGRAIPPRCQGGWRFCCPTPPTMSPAPKCGSTMRRVSISARPRRNRAPRITVMSHPVFG